MQPNEHEHGEYVEFPAEVEPDAVVVIFGPRGHNLRAVQHVDGEPLAPFAIEDGEVLMVLTPPLSEQERMAVTAMVVQQRPPVASMRTTGARLVAFGVGGLLLPWTVTAVVSVAALALVMPGPWWITAAIMGGGGSIAAWRWYLRLKKAVIRDIRTMREARGSGGNTNPLASHDKDD